MTATGHALRRRREQAQQSVNSLSDVDAFKQAYGIEGDPVDYLERFQELSGFTELQSTQRDYSKKELQAMLDEAGFEYDPQAKKAELKEMLQ